MRRFFRLFAVAALSAGFFFAKAGEGNSSGETVLLNDKEGDKNSSFEQQSATPSPKFKKTQLRFSGFSRVLGLYRNMGNYYAGTELGGRPLTVPVAIAIDDGAAQPLLMLRIEANPSANSSLQFECGLNNYLLTSGSGIQAIMSSGRSINVFAGFHVKGSTITNLGKFTMTAGAGSIWAKMSPFTMWNFQPRDDMFVRYPWDPAGSNWRRYQSYYSTGDVPRDQRWGNRGIQGFVIEGKDMPFGLESKLMYGKSRSTGGFNNWSSGIPQNMVGARVSKNLGTIKIGANYYEQFGYDTLMAITDRYFEDVFATDSTGKANRYIVEEANRTSQRIFTGDAIVKMNNLRLYTEIGAGSYFSKTYYKDNTFAGKADGSTVELKRNWSPLVYLEADIKKGLIGWPFKASLFYIGQHAVNNQGTFFNASIAEAADGRNIGINSTDAIWNTFFWDGMVAEIGQLANNRQGIDLTSKGQFGKLIAKLGLQFATEVVNRGATGPEGRADSLNGVRGGQFGSDGVLETPGVRNSITFAHLVNQYQRSRFHYNQRFQGPYSRLQSDYRRAWENIAITDTVVDYKKSFSVFELALKYKMKLFKKDLLLFGFYRQNTIGDGFPLPALKADGENGAFLIQRFEEFMVAYRIHEKVSLIAIAAWEQAQGNKFRTELADENGVALLDENGVPTPYAKLDDEQKGKVGGIDQVGDGYGLGVDYDFTQRANLNLRYRVYNHKDKNFKLDRFDGQEVTLEIKVFF